MDLFDLSVVIKVMMELSTAKNTITNVKKLRIILVIRPCGLSLTCGLFCRMNNDSNTPIVIIEATIDTNKVNSLK